MPGATQSSDFQFVPKVWQDHVDAYFRRKLVFGAFALQDRTLTAAPGETVNFPFFIATGDAEEPDEDQGLTVDKLSDDAFSATVKEVGKALGVKMKALRKSAARRERIFSEIQSQIGQKMAEKIDRDLITEIATSSVAALTAVAAAEVMTVKQLARGKIRGFGDRSDEAVAVFMHSLQWEDLLTDGTAGLLKADANSPFQAIKGFQGTLLNMAVIVTDNVPVVVGGIDGKQAFDSYIVKENAYGFMTAEEMEMERDKDILHREWVFAGTQWYAVKNFHTKIATDDLRIARLRLTTSVDV